MQGSCKITIANIINATELLCFVFNCNHWLKFKQQKAEVPMYLVFPTNFIFCVYDSLRQRLLVFHIPCLQGGNTIALPSNLYSLVQYLSYSLFVLIVFVFIVFRISCLQGGNTIASPAQSLFSPPVFTTATSETIRSQCAY